MAGGVAAMLARSLRPSFTPPYPSRLISAALSSQIRWCCGARLTLTPNGGDVYDRSPPRKQMRSLMSAPLPVPRPLPPLLHPDRQIGISGADC
ncbi:hypothetical protein KOW79_013277 [Hemibagrus wyckioides]|uniref:Uncharacterized protein n=1 Tax=Hemibagrus wyckioides TaxID=337641 RepID=A0A9D3NK53_9TELE|nr:hypothetical protein KOW79_013277 [Hemibagrus wyckioides]